MASRLDILTILIGYISQIGGEKLTSDQLRDSIKAVDILSVSIYTCNSYSQSTTTRKEKIMKKLTKTTALILSALMLFGCTSNSATGSVGDTTPPVENSVTDSKNESSGESSATENSSVTDNTSKESEKNLVKNIEGYQTFSYDKDKYEITNEYIYSNTYRHLYSMYLPVEPNLDDLYKETIDVKSSELVALKCRVAGDSYVIIDGKCGETLIMKPFLSLIYTPVVIEEVVDSNNGKCLYNKGDILYIRESYRITEPYNDRSLNFVQKAEENLKAQFENKSGEFDSSHYSEIEKNIMTGKWNITTL